jgi:iron-sulfur cluster assembly protein
MITLTDAARAEVKRLMAAQKLSGAFLRMGVRGGGCSGLSYSLDFDSELGPHDRRFEVDGITVVVDAKSYLYLCGTALDYVQRGLTGGFVFQNPNVRQTCGCGSSFAPR